MGVFLGVFGGAISDSVDGVGVVSAERLLCC